MTTVIRFSYRILRLINSKRSELKTKKDGSNVMLIGAGAAANAILKEIETSSYLNLNPKCIIDDNPGCHGKFLRGVPIVGGRDKIADAVGQYNVDEIIFAIPSANTHVKKEILDICKETGCKMRTLPGMYQLINGDVSVAKLKEVEIEDLLGRDPIEINTEEVLNYVKDKVILVTGGGGSIGSELCRQISGHQPKQLIIVDIYENNAYAIQQELIRKYPTLDLVVLIASVRNTERIEDIFRRYRPNIVYHAAAHKHVPLMEVSPNEAIKNNVFGTYRTAQAADKYGVEKFVLISTDKAVNPTNVMGASKRMCEMVIQMMNRKSQTNFVAVRFGMYWAVTQCHSPVQETDCGRRPGYRYGSEHYSLLHDDTGGGIPGTAGGRLCQRRRDLRIRYGRTSEDRRLGDKPDQAVRIQAGRGYRNQIHRITSRGEDVSRLLMSEEGLKKTANKMIYIGKPIEFDDEVFQKQLDKIYKDAYDETDRIREDIKEIVPTYQLKEQRR